MDVSKKITILLAECTKTQKDIAKILGCTQANISKKMSTNNWKVDELNEIAKNLGYELEVNFNPKKSGIKHLLNRKR